MIRVVDTDSLLREATTSVDVAGNGILRLASFCGVHPTPFARALRAVAESEDRRASKIRDILGKRNAERDLQRALEESSAASSAAGLAGGAAAALRDKAAVVRSIAWDDLLASSASGGNVAAPAWPRSASIAAMRATQAAGLDAAAAMVDTKVVDTMKDRAQHAILLTHVINPFFADSTEHRRAMRLTLASIANAAGYAHLPISGRSVARCYRTSKPHISLCTSPFDRA